MAIGLPTVAWVATNFEASVTLTGSENVTDILNGVAFVIVR